MGLGALLLTQVRQSPSTSSSTLQVSKHSLDHRCLEPAAHQLFLDATALCRCDWLRGSDDKVEEADEEEDDDDDNEDDKCGD